VAYISTNADISQFKQFPVEKLLDNSVTDFDLFLSVEDHLILYSGTGYRWHRQELNDLIKHGITWFYIRPGDKTRSDMYEKVSNLPAVEKMQAPKERINSIHDIAASFTKYLYEGDLTPSCIKKAEMIAASLVDCVQEDPTCVKEISGLNDHDAYTYRHSVRVSSYACAIAIYMGVTDVAQLNAITLGGIMHDIGKSMVPLTILNKAGPLTDFEWQLMRSHPKNGYEKIKDMVNGHIPREIALHHHEKLNGKGYPDGLDAHSIITEVQIATLADVFDALTSSRSYQNKRTRYEALDFIKHKMLKTEISVDAFKALIECLVK